MKKSYSYIDSSNKSHDIVIDEHSFELKKKDENILDVSLKTKPTTFLKDAFKRFCKSKAAIVSTFILAFIIVCSLVVPMCLPFDTSGSIVGTQYLPPKVFQTGTGFWDGTKKYSNIIFNNETNLPDGNFDYSAILNNSLSTYESTIDTNPSKLAKGGYIRIASSGSDEYIVSSSSVSINPTSTLKLEYEIDENISQNYRSMPFNIGLFKDDIYIKLVSSSTDFGSKEVDVSSVISSYSKEELENVSLRVGFDGDNSDEMIGIFLKSIKLFENNNELKEVTMDDANNTLLNSTYFVSQTSLSGLVKASVTLCSFTYDPYKAAYGNTDIWMGIDEFVSKYMQTTNYNNLVEEKKTNPLIQLPDNYLPDQVKYDSNIGPSSFELLDDSLDIIAVSEQRGISAAGISTIEIKCTVSNYKKLGYKTMPNHIFGTDANGVDMFKYVCEGVRNSLGVAFLIALICFVFGLVFGAIEGYFGGSVDLILERFVEILSNIPSIILITILVLKLGQNFSVFMLAMCITGWIGTSSITRTQFYRFKRREYVLASRSLGASDTRLIFKHILPNAIGTIITSSVLMIPSVIYSEATISYLGIGLSDKASLGNILSTNQINISTNQYLLLFPTIVLAVMLICFNMFGNGLRDALNPSLKGSD